MVKTVVDLRKGYDHKGSVPGGAVYLKGATVQAWGDSDSGPVPETWSLPETAENRVMAREEFVNMVERWSGALLTVLGRQS